MANAVAVEQLGAACKAKLIAGVCSVVSRWEASNGGNSIASQQVGILLSGGVDTCAVMEAIVAAHEAKRIEVLPTTALTVYASEEATDIPYAPLVVKEFVERGYPLDHHEIKLGATELLEEPLTQCICDLGSFDGMQLRNSIVVAKALMEAKKLGLKYLFTGDASDELLGGYSFSWNTEDPVWSQKRAEMCSEWLFSGPIIAQSLGLYSDSPFCEEVFREWALNKTGKEDCIGEVSCEATPGGERQFRRTGKLPLRFAFPNAPSAWRRKDPIEVGSGSTMLGKDGGKWFASKIGEVDLSHEQKRIKEEDGITIRTAEHLFYYRRFVDVFPKSSWTRPREDGSPLPPRLTPGANNACIECSFKLYNDTALFCRTCGAWPARKQETK